MGKATSALTAFIRNIPDGKYPDIPVASIHCIRIPISDWTIKGYGHGMELFLSFPSEAPFDVFIFPFSEPRPANFVLFLAHYGWSSILQPASSNQQPDYHFYIEASERGDRRTHPSPCRWVMDPRANPAGASGQYIDFNDGNPRPNVHGFPRRGRISKGYMELTFGVFPVDWKAERLRGKREIRIEEIEVRNPVFTWQRIVRYFMYVWKFQYSESWPSSWGDDIPTTRIAYEPPSKLTSHFYCGCNRIFHSSPGPDGNFPGWSWPSMKGSNQLYIYLIDTIGMYKYSRASIRATKHWSWRQVEECKCVAWTRAGISLFSEYISYSHWTAMRSLIHINSIVQAPRVVHPSSEVINPCTYTPGKKLIITILHCKVEISLRLTLVENLHPFRFQAFHSIKKHITEESDLIVP